MNRSPLFLLCNSLCNSPLRQQLLLVLAVFGIGSVSLKPHAACAEEMQYPLDVAAGPEDVVYVADRKLPGIWKIQEGKLELFFQGAKTFRTPLNAVRCVAVDEEGTLFAGDSATREVYAFDQDRQPVPLTGGSIGIASTILIDGERLIVADLETQRIWSIPKTGGKPTEVAVLAGVRGLARSTGGELLAVTTLEEPVRTLPAEGPQQVLISGRPFQMPHHAVAIEGHLFVVDNYACTLWRVALEQGAEPEAFVQGDPLQKPVGLCRYREGLLVADPHARKIFAVTSDGAISAFYPPAE